MMTLTYFVFLTIVSSIALLYFNIESPLILAVAFNVMTIAIVRKGLKLQHCHPQRICGFQLVCHGPHREYHSTHNAHNESQAVIRRHSSSNSAHFHQFRPIITPTRFTTGKPRIHYDQSPTFVGSSNGSQCLHKDGHSHTHEHMDGHRNLVLQVKRKSPIQPFKETKKSPKTFIPSSLPIWSNAQHFLSAKTMKNSVHKHPEKECYRPRVHQQRKQTRSGHGSNVHMLGGTPGAIATNHRSTDAASVQRKDIALGFRSMTMEVHRGRKRLFDELEAKDSVSRKKACHDTANCVGDRQEIVHTPERAGKGLAKVSIETLLMKACSKEGRNGMSGAQNRRLQKHVKPLKNESRKRSAAALGAKSIVSNALQHEPSCLLRKVAHNVVNKRRKVDVFPVPSSNHMERNGFKKGLLASYVPLQKVTTEKLLECPFNPLERGKSDSCGPTAIVCDGEPSRTYSHAQVQTSSSVSYDWCNQLSKGPPSATTLPSPEEINLPPTVMDRMDIDVDSYVVNSMVEEDFGMIVDRPPEQLGGLSTPPSRPHAPSYATS